MKYAALVIALNKYDNNPDLINALNDGKAMADKFRELKYDVVELFEPDATYAGYSKALHDLIELDYNNRYDAIILYFSGHGFMTNMSDYLAMQDCSKLEEHQGLTAATLSIRLQDFIEKMRSRCVTKVIAILDACRDDLSDYASITRGIRGMRDYLSSKFGSSSAAPRDTFIAYSTTASMSASDGGSAAGHSRYTAALLEEILKPIPIEQVFKNVRKRVHLRDKDQLPWEHTCLTEDFYFNYGQLDPYYGKPYPKDCYECENYTSFDATAQQIQSLLLSKDESDRSKGLIALTNHRQSLNGEDLFVIGRIVMQQAINGSASCKKFVESRRLEGYKKGNENDLANGLLYDLYFDGQNKYTPKTIYDFSLLNSLMQFSRNDYCASSVKFIRQELDSIQAKPFYRLGNSQFYSVYVELEKTDYTTKDGSAIYYIEEIVFDDEDYRDKIELEPYMLEPREIRVELSRFFQIPQIQLRVSMSDVKHILKNRIPDRLEEILFDVLVSNPVDDIDQLCSSGYSPNDCSILYLEDVQVEDDYMMIEGGCNASFDLYFDDDTLSVSFPGSFSIEMEFEKGKWRNRSHSPFSFDTSNYYN